MRRLLGHAHLLCVSLRTARHVTPGSRLLPHSGLHGLWLTEPTKKPGTCSSPKPANTHSTTHLCTTPVPCCPPRSCALQRRCSGPAGLQCPPWPSTPPAPRLQAPAHNHRMVWVARHTGYLTKPQRGNMTNWLNHGILAVSCSMTCPADLHHSSAGCNNLGALTDHAAREVGLYCLCCSWSRGV